MIDPVVISSFRPDAVLWEFWDEVIGIEQDAQRLDIEFLEAA